MAFKINSDEYTSSCKSVTFNPSGLEVLSAADHRYYHINYDHVEYTEIHVFVREASGYKRQRCPAIVGIKAVIHCYNGQNIELKPDKEISLKTLYKFIDCRRYFKDFKMYVDGPDTFDLPLRIYSKFGIKIPIEDDLGMTAGSVFCAGMGISLLMMECFQYSTPVAAGVEPCSLFVLGLIISLACVYREYLKYTIRKAVGL